MPKPGGKSRSRRRNPDEFGVSSLSIGGSSFRKRKDEGALDLETYRAARLASGLTTAEDYAQAARELAELLERGYATAEKRCADALWEDCLLAVSRTAHLERTVETTDSSDAVLRAARRVLPAARRAELERARRDAAVARKRREKRGNRSISPDLLRSFDDDDDDDDAADDDDDADAAPHLTRGAARRLATFGDLPGDVLGLVLDRLHPHALARAGCVSSEWRARAESSDRWRALALAAFGESRCAAAEGEPENAGGTSNARKQKPPRSRGGSWRAAFEIARARWPAMAPRRHTRRAFCETCQTLAWFPGVRGFPSRARGRDVTPKGKGKGSAALVASCGCAAATFARRSKNAKNENRLSNPNPKLRSRDAAVSAAAVALPFAVTPRRAARCLLRAARRKARKARKASDSSSGSSDSSESSDSDSSAATGASGSGASSDEGSRGERRLWQT